MKRKLGLKPVSRQPALTLADYYRDDLPSVESLTFPLGHPDAIAPRMFLNQALGDCAIAGSIEEVRLANALRGVTVDFDDETALANYSQITGYTPAEPDTDQGTDVHQLYQFRRSTGLLDAEGNRHKIIAYAGLRPGDFHELLVALSLFDMVGVGINVPDYAEAQFEAGKPWALLPGRHTIVGGHYVPVVGAPDATTVQFYTWGALASMDSGFYAALNTVAVVALTEELFNGDGKTPEGVDFERLATDLASLDAGPVSAKAPRKPRSRKDAA